jgi:hypothetical protein
VNSVRVFPGGDEKRARGVGADSESFEHLGRNLGDQRCEAPVKGTDLVVEFEGRASILNTTRFSLVTSVRAAGRNAARCSFGSLVVVRAVRISEETPVYVLGQYVDRAREFGVLDEELVHVGVVAVGLACSKAAWRF